VGLRGELGVPGPRGPAGEISYIYVGAPELEAAHKQILASRARVLATIIQKLEAMGNHPVYKVAAMHLQDVQREVEKMS
jgi:hypothetical protein